MSVIVSKYWCPFRRLNWEKLSLIRERSEMSLWSSGSTPPSWNLINLITLHISVLAREQRRGRSKTRHLIYIPQCATTLCLNTGESCRSLRWNMSETNMAITMVGLGFYLWFQKLKSVEIIMPSTFWYIVKIGFQAVFHLKVPFRSAVKCLQSRRQTFSTQS